MNPRKRKTNRRTTATGKNADVYARAACDRLSVIALLGEYGSMTNKEIAGHMGYELQPMRQRLATMVQRGEIQSNLVPHTKSPFIAMYSLGESDGSDNIRQRTVHKYPLHHVRDELVTYLFGAPTKGNDHAQE